MRILIYRFGVNDPVHYAAILQVIDELDYELIGFVDNDTRGGEFVGRKIYGLSEIGAIDYDKLLIFYTIADEFEVPVNFARSVGVPAEKVSNIFWLLRQKMRIKYEDTQDDAIRETLRYWEHHELSVFNQHEAGREPTFSEVFFDSASDLPFIVFPTVDGAKRRMYYPKTHQFKKIDGRLFVKDVLGEQAPGSPHLYTRPGHDVREGDIVIDAGVCEGNFALRYVNTASAIYLFEANPEWEKPLYYTFRDDFPRVSFHRQFVSGTNGAGSVTLDAVLPEMFGRRVFLKMDIEGAEPYALKGARGLLQKNDVTCSVCSYHRANDEVRIKSVLRHLGYRAEPSTGYMVFAYSPDIWAAADFRRGVIYGWKE